MARTLLLHLSDLHLCQSPDRAPKPTLWDSLAAAIRTVVESAPNLESVAVAITGDLVDSSETDLEVARAAVQKTVHGIRDAIGRPAPMVLLPGNHDRRSSGVISPWSHGMVKDLAATLAKIEGVTLFAADAHEPLAAPVPALSEALGAEVVVYDSTHTLAGKFSAGGLFRADDLLAVRSLVAALRPVVVLLHHHIVPTPVTDVSLIDSGKARWWERQLLNRALPWLVTFGNREELTMTALGAGTALTLLHALGSAVVVLHGHKHYPTARLMRGPRQGDGDVLLASAGSAGLLEPYVAAGRSDPAYLWPSFNAMWFEGDVTLVETVFFSPDAPKPIYRQPLASARREGAAWRRIDVEAPAVARDEVITDTATFTLSKGAVGYWDLACERLIVPALDGLEAYEEPIEATSRSEVTGDFVSRDERGRPRIKVQPNQPARYRCTSAVFRNVSAAARECDADAFSPFESIGLHVQRGTRTATMTVRGLPGIADKAFATLTDLHTGQQRPIATSGSGDELTVVVKPCPARRLLRVHWLLDA